MTVANSAKLVTIHDDQHFGYTMPTLSSQDLQELARLFSVEKDRITVSPHPLEAELVVIAIRFIRGINVAPALASYFNHEFYKVPKGADNPQLLYRPNSYAYVDEQDYGRTLCLTASGDKANFIAGLLARSDDISYVISHPEILFMMHPDIDYVTARVNLRHGFRPSV